MEFERSIVKTLASALKKRLHVFQGYTLTYWRDGDKEVDFVVTRGPSIWAIEVKSGRSGKVSGLERFRSKYRKAKAFVVGATGISLEKFFSEAPEVWLQD